MGITNDWLAFQFDYHCLRVASESAAEQNQGGVAAQPNKGGKFDESQFGNPLTAWHPGKRNVKVKQAPN